MVELDHIHRLEEHMEKILVFAKAVQVGMKMAQSAEHQGQGHNGCLWILLMGVGYMEMHLFAQVGACWISLMVAANRYLPLQTQSFVL